MITKYQAAAPREVENGGGNIRTGTTPIPSPTQQKITEAIRQGKGEYPPPSTPIEFTGEWRCEYCGAVYAEYVNGCPKCFMGETGTSSKVVWVPKLSTPNGSGSSETGGGL